MGVDRGQFLLRGADQWDSDLFLILFGACIDGMHSGQCHKGITEAAARCRCAGAGINSRAGAGIFRFRFICFVGVRNDDDRAAGVCPLCVNGGIGIKDRRSSDLGAAACRGVPAIEGIASLI